MTSENTVSQLERRAVDLLKAEKWADALQLIDLIVGHRPRAPAAWYHKAVCHVHLKQGPQAVEALKRTLALAPDHAKAKTLLQQLRTQIAEESSVVPNKRAGALAGPATPLPAVPPSPKSQGDVEAEPLVLHPQVAGQSSGWQEPLVLSPVSSAPAQPSQAGARASGHGLRLAGMLGVAAVVMLVVLAMVKNLMTTGDGTAPIAGNSLADKSSHGPVAQSGPGVSYPAPPPRVGRPSGPGPQQAPQPQPWAVKQPPPPQTAAPDQRGRDVGQPKIQSDVQSSVNVLNDAAATPTAKAQAAAELGKWRDLAVPAIPLLVQQLENTEVAPAAARSLAQIGKPAIDALVNSIKGNNAGGAQACWALGEIGGPESAFGLGKVFRSSSGPTRDAAARALVRIGKPSLDTLSAILLEPDGASAREAARLLAAIRDLRAAEPLIAALGHKDVTVCEEAARSLGVLKAQNAVDPLLQMLKETREKPGLDALRKVGKDSLGQILGGERAGLLLAKTLREGPAWYRYKSGEVADLVVDKGRNCVWYAAGRSVGKIDLNTDEVSVVAKDMDARCLGLGQDQLWIGGHTYMSSNLTIVGGGLSVYDIPSQSVVTYTVANTLLGDRKGLQDNSVVGVTPLGDAVWICYDPAMGHCGLTRFRPREKERAAQWSTYTVENTKVGGSAGLAANAISAITPYGEDLLIGRDCAVKLNPKPCTFARFGVLQGQKDITARALNGKSLQLKVWPQSSPEIMAVDGRKIWFRASFPDRNGSWWPSVFCYDPQAHSYEIFTREDTGMVPDRLCVDGNDVWMVQSQAILACNALVVRYNKLTGERTQYSEATGCGITDSTRFRRVAATDDSVFFCTENGVLRYFKTDRQPKIIQTAPASGANQVQANEVSVIFDVPMNPKTINSGSMQLLINGAPAQGTVRYDPETRRAVFGMPHALPSGMNCELVVSSLIQAENGNPIRLARVQFSTK